MRDLARMFDEDGATFTPYVLQDGTPAGETALLRQRNTENASLYVGIYRCAEPVDGVQDYVHNDSMYILAGEARIQVSDGTELHLKPGDMATFAKGQRITFQQGAGFKKFFVMSE